MNWGPRLEMILSGNPNIWYKLSSKSFAVSSAVTFLLHGIRIAPLLSPWSTTTKMESKLSIGGRSVMKSIEQLENGLVVVAPSVGIKEVFEGCLSILNC